MAGNQVRVGVGVTGTAKAGNDLDRLKGKMTGLQKQGAKGFAIGAGAAVTAGAFGLLAGAGSKVIDVLGDATAAAMADEVSIKKLNTAISANVKGFDGNSDAIERVLKSRMKLGFSDDEQRESLALLVVATNDVNKALDLQRAAMDLARLKGVSLAEASVALTKIEGGQFRALKALGIELKAGATATDALAAVTKAAAGQAEAYANTASGRMLAAQTNINEKMEEFGYRILPVVSTALEEVMFAVDKSSGSMDRFLRAVRENDMGAAKLALEIQAAADALGIDFKRAWEIASETGLTSAADIIAASRRQTDALEDARLLGRSALLGLAGGFEDLADEATKDTRTVTEKFNDMVESLSNDVSSLIDDVYDPAIQAAELAAIRHEKAELRKVLASKNATAEEKQNAKDRLLSLSKSADETRLALLESGNLTAEETKTWLDKLQRRYDKSTGAAKTKIAQLIARIRELAAVEAGGITIKVNGPSITGGGSGSNAKGDDPAARGGYRSGRTLVGEEGPEVVDLPAGSYVNDAQKSASMMGGDTFNITFTGGIGQSQTMLMDQVERMRRISRGRRR